MIIGSIGQLNDPDYEVHEVDTKGNK